MRLYNSIGRSSEHLQTPPRLPVHLSSSFTAEPVEASLTWWLEQLGWTPQVTFAPYNQVFQELLNPVSGFARMRDGVNVVLVRLEDWSRSQTAIRGVHVGNPDSGRYKLPNGLEVAHLNRYETDYVYQEIFGDRVYLRHGITIENGDCIIDIGANIGLFSLFVARHAPQARVFACEPSPTTFDALRQNLEAHAPHATALHCGVGEVNRRMAFTAYARSSVFSSFHANAAEDRDAILSVVRNVLREQAAIATETVDELADSLVADRLESRQVEVDMRTLSSLIREQAIDQIDLLKIDAEKSELGILRGLDPQDWSRIRQIVIEVHDTTGSVLPEVRALLAQHDFEITGLDEEHLLHGSGLFNVYATRRDAVRRLPAPAADEPSEFARTISELAAAVRESSSRGNAPHVVVVCPPSAAARSDETWMDEARRLEEQLAADLADVAGLRVVTSAALESVYPDTASHDASADAAGRIPYTPLGFAALGTQVAREIYASVRPAAKVLVVDCDNTLWDGVCGEDGAAGIRFGKGNLALQRFLIDQHALGRLICLCSKNDEDDVMAVFESRGDCELRLDHLTAWRINWQSKAANLRALAAELDLGLDSFVFIDDNPTECAEVRAGCPEVLTLQMPGEAAAVEHLLRHAWPCDRRQQVTAEDTQRTAMYRQNADRSRYREQASSFEAFIAGLGLDVRIEPLNADTMARAAQLTERTNQFNFTTIRRSEAAIRSLVEDRQLEFLTIRVADRFGDYGLVGLIGFSEARRRLDVESFMLSCRVLGKGVEHRIVAHLGAVADERGLEGVNLRFVPTKRNTPALQFVQSLTAAVPEAIDQGVTYRFTTSSASAVRFDPAESPSPVLEEAVGTGGAEPPTDPAFLARIPGELSAGSQVLNRIGRARQTARPVASPRTPIEERLVRLWSECLGQTPGIEENYFDLGGDSIRAVQIASRAQAEGLQLSPKQVLEHQTIAALAAVLGDTLPASAPSSASRRFVLDANARAQLAETHPALADAYPLTPMQTMFCVQYAAGLNVGFEQWQLRLEGRLSLDEYRRAWSRTVDRHEALRTAFKETGVGEPWQIVLREANVPWHEEKLDGLSAADQSKRLTEYLDADRSRRFDLGRPPLMRVAVFSLGNDQWHVVWTFHHLVIDGWSSPIVLGDVAREYAAGKGSTGPLVYGAQFKRLVEWQLEARPEAEAFWAQALAGFDATTPLPRGEGVASRGQEATEWRVTIPRETAAAIADRARAERVTVGTIFQAAWAVLLGKLSRRDDVVFGVTMSGRPPEIEGVENIVGTFVNNVPIRARIERSWSPHEFVRWLQQQVNGAAENQFLALARIQQLSSVPVRDRLFDSLIVIQNYLGAGWAPAEALGADARVVAVDAPIRTGYPVTLVVTPATDLTVRLIARDLAWPDGLGRQVLDEFVTVVSEMVVGQVGTVGELAAGEQFDDWPVDEGRATTDLMAQTGPRTPLEGEIFSVFESVFGHGSFGVDANFFDLGGHSLLMLKVHEALQARLKRQISIVDLFEYPSVEGLARRLSGESQQAGLRAAKTRAQLQIEAMARQRRRGGAS